MAMTDYENFVERESETSDDSKNEENSPEMQRRLQTIQSLWSRYRDVMERTGFADTSEMNATERWINQTQLTSRREVLDSIVYREEFFKGYGKQVIEEGPAVEAEFFSKLNEIAPYISTQSKERWIRRFHNSSVNFLEKKYWIRQQFPHYIIEAKDVAEKREILMNDPKFQLIDRKLIDVSKIKNKNVFFELHFNERKGLLAKARAAILAVDKGQGDLYVQAKGMLNKAVRKRVLASHKTGVWLERIFKTSASREKIEAFLEGSDGSSLGVLIGKWDQVKNRYDRVMEKVKQRGKNHVRGWFPVSEDQFLNMHYTQRLRYVEESEDRINGANDIRAELPVFINIRHALDTHDWEEADEQIAKAGKMELSGENRERLQSMKRYLKQFRTDALQGKVSPNQSVREAKEQIDNILPLIPQSMRGLVLRGLYSSQANRFIHQLRWIIYNNKWCRDKGYLNAQRANQFKNKESEERTHEAGTVGGDTGMHDVMNTKNNGSSFIRKEEYAKTKPTYRHVDIGKGGVISTMGEWLEKEQHPKVLYWTTFCANDGDMPMSETWHNDLFHNLTALRGATRKIESAGFKYGGPGRALISKN